MCLWKVKKCGFFYTQELRKYLETVKKYLEKWKVRGKRETVRKYLEKWKVRKSGEMFGVRESEGE